MTTMQFKFPAREGLLCEVHGCKELADWVVKTGADETFACKEHYSWLKPALAKRGARLDKLRVPGDHNQEVVDTSDIPEASEDWFKKATLKKKRMNK